MTATLLLILAVVAVVTRASDVPFPCDCGSSWTSFGAPAAAPVAPTALSPSVTTNTKLVLISQIPVVDPNQAKLVCWQNLMCNGFLLYNTGLSGYLTAFLFTYSRTVGSLSATPGLEGVFLPASTLYILNRFEFYDCPSLVLDPYFYYFQSGVRPFIERNPVFCPYYNATTGQCCWQNDLQNNCTSLLSPTQLQANPSVVSQRWVISAYLYWNTTGFAVRQYSPNSDCALVPTLWTADSECVTPQDGCDEFNFIPCGGQGNCVVNTNELYDTPFSCSCYHYNGVFDNIAEWMGNACQYPTHTFCTPPQNNTGDICSGYHDACQPQLLPNTCPGSCDYEPECKCGTVSPPIPATGSFCETNLCDSVNQCKSQGPLGGQCNFHSGQSPPWSCDCGINGVGSTCQYPTAGCKQTPTASALCDGFGQCMPPFMNNSIVTSDPNYSFSAAWCLCTQQRSFGQFCQNLNCDPTTVTAGRGQCDVTSGVFLSCYPPYSTSGRSGTIKCDVDDCATTGGSVVPGSPPATCSCAPFWTGSQLPVPESDISCFPKCPTLNGVLCGGTTGGAGTNQCTQITFNNTRASVCTCVVGYTQVAAPTPENNFLGMRAGPAGFVVCEKYCVNGVFTVASTCDCTGTGYSSLIDDLGVAHPRCDNPICKNGGLWQSSTGTCTCVGPFKSSSALGCVTSPTGCCSIQTCDNPTSLYIEGSVAVDPTDSTRRVCSCDAPFAHSAAVNSTAWTDCSVSMCGVHGAINPNILIQANAAVTQYMMCTCSAGWKTVCFDSTGLTCSFCASVDTCAPNGAFNYTTMACTCVSGWTSSSLSHQDCSLSLHPLSSSSSTGSVFHVSSSSTGPIARGNFSSSTALGSTGSNQTISRSASARAHPTQMLITIIVFCLSVFLFS